MHELEKHLQTDGRTNIRTKRHMMKIIIDDFHHNKSAINKRQQKLKIDSMKWEKGYQPVHVGIFRVHVGIVRVHIPGAYDLIPGAYDPDACGLKSGCICMSKQSSQLL